MALNRKRRVFVEEYLKCWNGSEAARQAGYAHPGSQAHRLLKNDEIQQLIRRRVNEKCMAADEVLLRLADMARADIRGLVSVREDNSWNIDWETAEGKTHLIKSAREGKYGLTLELYDAQAALEKIGKVHGLFRDVQQIEGEASLVVRLKWDDADTDSDITEAP